MKIAVLADVHANFRALQAAVDHMEAWKPDQVIIAGDLVNRGPRPKECLQFVFERVERQGWLLIRGNHEDYVINQAESKAPRFGPPFEVHKASYWTYLQLDKDVAPLKSMPEMQVLNDPGGGLALFVHGSRLGMRDGIYPETSNQSLYHKIGLDHQRNSNNRLSLFAVGHTHRPLIRKLDGVLIVNAGSVGLPFDHDTRLAYAQITWEKGQWNADIVRLSYDFRGAERDFGETGYLENGGPLVKLVQIELITASSQLYDWSRLFQQPAIEGQISMEESVSRYLEMQSIPLPDHPT